MPSTSLFCRLGCGQPVKEQGRQCQEPRERGRTENEKPSIFDSLEEECYQRFTKALIYEAGFLIDNESYKLLADVEPELLPRAQCVVILHALGVQSSDGLHKIYTMLTDKKDEEDDIVTVSELKGFVQGEKILQEHLQAQAAQNAKQEIDHPFKVGPKRAKALALKLKWDEYWRSFTLVISERVLRVWRHLESALVNYNQILKDRIEDVPNPFRIMR